jgi:hypothetical protein
MHVGFVLEELRKRVAELRERAKTRRLIRGEEAGTTAGGVIGGGKVIETVTERIDKFIATVKEKRPNIIPTVLERIKTYEPGKRIKELVPLPKREETVAPPPAEGKKILRE